MKLADCVAGLNPAGDLRERLRPSGLRHFAWADILILNAMASTLSRRQKSLKINIPYRGSNGPLLRCARAP